MRNPQLAERLYIGLGLLLAFAAMTAGMATVAAAAPRPQAARQVAHVAAPQAAAGSTARAALKAAPTPVARLANPPAFKFSARPQARLGLAPASAILVDLGTGRVLWSVRSHTRRATASLAKIFTVMVAIDSTSMDRIVVVPPGGQDDDPTHSVMGLTVGDRVSIRQLVEGVWLASGDDAAETLARTIMPRAQFVAAMNAKAAYLGLRDTHFTNPSGLDQPGEYSSAYDMAIAGAWVQSHYTEAFRLAGLRRVPLPANAWRHRDMTLKTVNRLLDDFPTRPGKAYPGATGLKTGYTDNAGGCIVTTAQRHKVRLIAVVMGSDFFFTDAGSLLDYGWRTLTA